MGQRSGFGNLSTGHSTPGPQIPGLQKVGFSTGGHAHRGAPISDVGWRAWSSRVSQRVPLWGRRDGEPIWGTQWEKVRIGHVDELIV